MSYAIARSTDPGEVPHPLPTSLVLGGRPRVVAKPRGRRHRLFAAESKSARRGAGAQFLLPQQFHPELAGRGGRRGDQCPRVSGGPRDSCCSSSPAPPFPPARPKATLAAAAPSSLPHWASGTTN